MMRAAFAVSLLLVVPSAAPAQDAVADVAEKVNQRVVKLFGAGRVGSLSGSGTGLLVSADGFILTAATALLDVGDPTVHLYDGRKFKSRVVVVEKELDLALLQIVVPGKRPGDPTGLDLAFFDVVEAAKRPPAAPGTFVLATTNAFETSQRDEPMTVQRAVIGAVAKLDARRGVYDFPYSGEVYVLDTVTNNRGAAGGALTDRHGVLLGVVGRELASTQTETFVNYSYPVWAKVEVRFRVKEGDKEVDKVQAVSVAEFVEKGMRGEYKPVPTDRPEYDGKARVYTGIVFVPNLLPRTPAFVETVVPGSPAAGKLQPDDLVSFVDGEPVGSINEFEKYLQTKTKPGATVRLEVRRGTVLRTIDIVVEAPPVRPAAPPKK